MMQGRNHLKQFKRRVGLQDFRNLKILLYHRSKFSSKHALSALHGCHCRREAPGQRDVSGFGQLLNALGHPGRKFTEKTTGIHGLLTLLQPPQGNVFASANELFCLVIANGLARLHRDMEQIPSLEGLDDWIRVSEPPALGLALHNADFRRELKAQIRDFAPNLLIVDPWNACVRDAMEKDFQEGFSRLREVLAEAPSGTASLILHHLRKPKSEDRHKGRNLTNLLSGSYVLVSVARSVLVMQPATDDTEDARVVMTCSKNNDGQLGGRSVWERRDGALFVPVPDFDFEAYDSGGTKREAKVREEHLRELFEDGRRWLSHNHAAKELQTLADVGRSAAYEALKIVGGRFSNILIRDSEKNLISVQSTHLD